MAIESLSDIIKGGQTAFSTGGGGVYVGETAPLVPVVNMQWIDNSTGKTYTYYENDGNPCWVDFSNVTGGFERSIQSIIIAASDETTAITAGVSKVTFRLPYGFVLREVFASLTDPQVSGTLLSVDVLDDGVTILPSVITFVNGSDISIKVVSGTMVKYSEITVNVSTVGDGTAKGLKVALIGYTV